MTHLSLTDLEIKIDRLIHAYHNLLAENQKLQHEISELKQQRNLLLHKNSSAALQIKHVINQLRNNAEYL